MEEHQVLCTLSNIEKSYRKGPKVLGPLSLSVYAGEIIGLRGVNGAGKSTLLKILSGLLKPDAGKCWFSEELKGKIGYVPQEIALYGSLTGRENLLFWGSVYGLPAPVARTRSRWLLDTMELTGKANAPVETYSGGMQRKLHLASALMVTPKLLLLDEPTVGADARSAELILEAVRRARNMGCGVVFVTHRKEELEQVSDRILELRDGQILDREVPV